MAFKNVTTVLMGCFMLFAQFSFGRFLQTDPIGYKDDMDLYTYVGNDPLNKADPSGTSIVDIAFAISDIADFNDARKAGNVTGMVVAATMIGMDVQPVPGVSTAAHAANAARAANTARGRINEAKKLTEIDAKKNTEKVTTSTGDRIRDGTKADGTHVEVKDTKRLDNTAQLRGLDEAAGKDGQKLEVYTGENTTVSNNVNERTLPNTRIIKCPDLGPQCK